MEEIKYFGEAMQMSLNNSFINQKAYSIPLHSFMQFNNTMDIELRDNQEQKIQDAPFMVMYNYRHNLSHPPKPRLPKPLKQPTHQAHPFILTRKMAAEKREKSNLETKEDDANRYQQQQKIQKQESDVMNDFFATENLEKGIPMQDRNDEDILYNLNSMSMASNYSKLQKTLFGLTFNEINEQPQEETLF